MQHHAHPVEPIPPSPAPARTPTCPPLPTELWLRILTYHTDLCHLWTSCRRVSPTFRAYVDAVFAATHLRAARIDWALEKYHLTGNRAWPCVPTLFSRFDADAERVWFRVCDVEGGFGFGAERLRNEPGLFGRVMQRWDENVNESRGEMPNYVIRVGGRVNDTEIPGVEMRLEEREVGFLWRGMLEMFFKEEEWVGWRERVWATRKSQMLSQQPHSQSQSQSQIVISKNQDLPPEDTSRPWRDVHAFYKKQVRRKRLREQYQDDEEMVWAIESLDAYDSITDKNGRTVRALSEIPGAGLGEKWFGSTFMVQSLWIDEWSCLQRIAVKAEMAEKEGR